MQLQVMLRGGLESHLKITKAVMCKIMEPEEMPIDSEGNRADVVMDPNSTIGRMNIGRLYEQYYNASARDTFKRLCTTLGVKPFIKERHALATIDKLPEETIQKSWDYLMGFYAIISPVMRSWFDDPTFEQTRRGYLAEIVERGITVFMPTNNQPESEDIVAGLQEHYRPLLGPISYIGNSGKRVWTVENIRIAETYFILLEKIGDDWSAVSSCKLQHFGVPAQVTKADKYSLPARNQAVRGADEASMRIFVSYIGPLFAAEMMDRNNNPKTHAHLVKSILSSKYPSNIHDLVDRKMHPYGGAKPLQLVSHLSECSGFRFVYAPYKPHQITYSLK